MPRVVANLQGTFKVWTDPVGDAIAAGRFWDEHLRAAMDAADPDGLAIDVGANVGFHTVYLARRFKHVLALEAHPSTYQLLCRNVIENNVTTRVTALQFAAYDKITVLQMASGLLLGWQVPSETDLDLCKGAASLAFVPEGVGAPGDLRVPTVTVDSLVDSLTRVTFIKIDAQGCDLRALYGMSDLIARDNPPIIFEVEEEASLWHGDTLEAYFQFFLERDYSVTRIKEKFDDYYAVKL